MAKTKDKTKGKAKDAAKAEEKKSTRNSGSEGSSGSGSSPMTKSKLSQDAIFAIVDHWFDRLDIQSSTLSDMYEKVENHFLVTLRKRDRKLVRQRLRELNDIDGDGEDGQPQQSQSNKNNNRYAKPQTDSVRKSTAIANLGSSDLDDDIDDDEIVFYDDRSSTNRIDGAPSSKLFFDYSDANLHNDDSNSTTSSNHLSLPGISNPSLPTPSKRSQSSASLAMVPEDDRNLATADGVGQGKGKGSKKDARANTRYNNSDEDYMSDASSEDETASVQISSRKLPGSSSIPAAISTTPESTDDPQQQQNAGAGQDDSNDNKGDDGKADNGNERGNEQGNDDGEENSDGKKAKDEPNLPIFWFDNVIFSKPSDGPPEKDDGDAEAEAEAEAPTPPSHNLQGYARVGEIVGILTPFESSFLDAFRSPPESATICWKKHAMDPSRVYFVTAQQQDHFPWPHLQCQHMLQYVGQLYEYDVTKLNDTVEQMGFRIDQGNSNGNNNSNADNEDADETKENDEETQRSKQQQEKPKIPASTKIGDLNSDQHLRLLILMAILRQPDLIVLDHLHSIHQSILKDLSDIAHRDEFVVLCAMATTTTTQVLHQCDRLLLLAQDDVPVYFGSSKVISYMDRRGHKCPKNTGTVEFVVNVIQEDADENKLQKAWTKSSSSQLIESTVKQCREYKKDGPNTNAKQSPSLVPQMIHFIRRQCMASAIISLMQRCILILIFNILIAFAFLKHRDLEDKSDESTAFVVMTWTSILWALTTHLTSVWNMETTQQEMTYIFENELKNNVISIPSYILSTITIQLPTILILSIYAIGIPGYAILSFPKESFTVLWLLTLMLLWVYESTATMILCGKRRPLVIVTTIFIVWFAGIIPPTKGVVWPFRLLVYLSPLRYYVRSFVHSLITSHDFNGTCFLPDCTEEVILEYLGTFFGVIEDDDNIIADVCILFSMGCCLLVAQVGAIYMANRQ